MSKSTKKYLRDHALDVANQVAAREITNISDSKRTSVRNILRLAANQGWPKTQTKERLAEIIGLDERQAIALANYRRGLEAQFPGQRGKVSMMVKEQAARYRKRRVQTIANTEMANISNGARRAMWADRHPDRMREWITKDPCPICLPMNGIMTRVGEPYSNGMDGPPIHPNCRCVERLI